MASPDGTSYFSTYPGLGICLGNIQTGEFQRNLDELSVGFEIGVFSGDGDVLAAVSDLEIRIFNESCALDYFAIAPQIYSLLSIRKSL